MRATNTWRQTCIGAAALFLAAVSGANASPIIPTYVTFGSLPAATFGGSGIPNDAVAITTIVDGGNTITLGLTAFQRFFNPPLSNNGAGDFYATTGTNYGDPATPSTPGTPSTSLGSTWNLGWYVLIAGGGTIADYDFQLLYDLDSGAATDQSLHGTLLEGAVFSALLAAVSATESQASQNMLFSFWTTTIPGFIVPPAGSFNANVAGEYTFALQARTNAGAPLGQSAIRVNVSTVPEPGALSLILLALTSLFGLVLGRARTNA